MSAAIHPESTNAANTSGTMTPAAAEPSFAAERPAAESASRRRRAYGMPTIIVFATLVTLGVDWLSPKWDPLRLAVVIACATVVVALLGSEILPWARRRRAGQGEASRTHQSGKR